jgi:photosystem II stability/assembly factor-like uncharacterized protein
VSTNYGATWANTPQTLTRYGGLAACSADGKKLFIVSGSPYLACSTNTGQDWFFVTTNAPAMNNFFTASADGNTLVGGSDSGLFTSTNGGATWITNFPSQWSCAACSADGSKWIAGSGASYGLLISTNFGITWKSNSVPAHLWSSAAMSADGNTLVAITYAAPQPTIYASTNGGLNWTTNAAPMPYNRPHIAGSADLGTLLFWLEPSVGLTCTSTNLGASWSTNALPQDYWLQGLSTADGNRKILLKNHEMWVSTNASSPLLSIRPSGNDLLVSWLVPSSAFQLDQAIGDVSASWSAVTNIPNFNFSNLNRETLLSKTQSSAFFRLSGAQ